MGCRQVKSWSEIWKFLSVAGKISAQHCLSGLLKLKFHFSDPFIENLERSGCLSNMKVGSLEHFNVLIKEGIG